MRASSWFALALLGFGCSGATFTSQGTDDGAGGSGSSAGASNRAGTSSKGGTASKGGSTSSGATDSGGGTDNAGGDEPGSAGETSVGGSTSTSGNGGTGTGGSSAGSGGNPPVVDTVCPHDPPATAGACKKGLTCTYGSHLLGSCRTRATCLADGWSVEKKNCAELLACAPIVGGSACDPQKSPPCAIQENIYCVCTGCSGAGPCSSETVWKCAGGSGGQICPKTLPNEGASCGGQAECQYGSCTTGEVNDAACNGTAWVWGNTICPL